MPYPQAFLDLQLMFARKMAELTSQPYLESVRHNTALYRILGLDWSLDPHHPVWRRFAGELQEDDSDTAYRLYLERYAQGVIPDHNTPRWGCFSYDYQPETQVIRLHFANLDRSGYGPLTHQRRLARMVELWSLFSHIRRVHPDAAHVHGGSWLYNRVEYTRLFPAEYAQSATVDHPHLIARGLWGQFLRHGNRMHEEVAARFAERVAGLRDPLRYGSCFPYQNLLTSAPIGLFYQLYSVPASTGA